MDDGTLIKRLEAFEAPELEPSCARAKHAVRGQLRARRARSHRKRLVKGTRSRFTAALAALCLALTAGALFTPPGHAVTSWIGERLGFGQPGGPPTLRELRAFATKGGASEGQPAYVLLRGPVPSAGHYELITYRMKDEPGKLWPATGAVCFELNLPEARALYAPSCGLPPVDGLRVDGPVGGSMRNGSYYSILTGRVGVDIAAVEVALNGEPVPVQLTRIPEKLIERFAIHRPFKFFIASLPGGTHGGLVTVAARDAAGNAVAEHRRRLVDVVQMNAQVRALVCRDANERTAEGKANERTVRRSCR